MRIKDPFALFKYKTVKIISYIIRFLLCYFTIEKVPIFENETIQWIYSVTFASLLYTAFVGICYPIVGVFSKRYKIQSSAVKSGMYLLLYIPLSLIVYIVLLILTKKGTLPIPQEYTFNFFEFITNAIIAIINWIFKIFFDFIIAFCESISK